MLATKVAEGNCTAIKVLNLHLDLLSVFSWSMGVCSQMSPPVVVLKLPLRITYLQFLIKCFGLLKLTVTGKPLLLSLLVFLSLFSLSCSLFDVSPI